jgi:peptide/nickel transport system substrate-binding protein
MRYFDKVVSILLTVFMFQGCGGKSSEDQHREGDIFIWGRGADSKGLDPGKEEDGESVKVIDNIYEPLVTYKKDEAVIIPWLATSWEVSEDGLVYTFNLRRGVKFHDGTVFNADAVVLSIKRQFNKAQFKYWNSMNMGSLVEDVVKVDEYTVSFTLKQPSSLFLRYCTMHFMYIVSPAALEKYGEKYGTTVSVPAGSGPYKFKSWRKNDRIVLERFDDYWGEKAKMKYVVYKSIPDNTARLIALEKGEIHGMNFPDPENLPRIRQNKDLKLKSRVVLDIGYLAMKCSKAPFDDVRVRRAVSHAINKKQLVETMYPDVGVPAKNPLPPGLKGYNDGIADYEYDPAKARELLREAGYPDGFKTDLWYMPIPRGYMPNGKKIAEIIQSDLREVGIVAKLDTQDWATYLEYTSAGKHSMCLLGWSADIPDADNFLNVLLSMDLDTGERTVQNVAFYENPELQTMLNEARRISNEERRTEIYQKACEIVHNDAPWVPIAHTKFIVVLRENVQGLDITLLTKLFFNTVELREQ